LTAEVILRIPKRDFGISISVAALLQSSRGSMVNRLSSSEPGLSSRWYPY